MLVTLLPQLVGCATLLQQRTLLLLPLSAPQFVIESEVFFEGQ